MDVMDFRWKYACWWILDGFWMVFGWLKIDFDGFWMYVWILFGWIWDGLGQISFDGCFGWILEGSWMDFHAFWMDFCWFLDRFWWILDGFWIEFDRFWLVLDGFLLPADLPGLCLLSSPPYLGCTCASYVPSCISPSYLPGSSASPHRIQEVSGCFGMDFGLIWWILDGILHMWWILDGFWMVLGWFFDGLA